MTAVKYANFSTYNIGFMSIDCLLSFLQVDADYWLLSDGGVGITDMWRSDCILESYFWHFLVVVRTCAGAE